MGAYVETWKAIAFAVGRSERWCRYMARRATDPLPVFKVGGIVRLVQPDLDAWLLRQRDGGYHRGMELLAS
jgi:hypothetical protein